MYIHTYADRLGIMRPQSFESIHVHMYVYICVFNCSCRHVDASLFYIFKIFVVHYIIFIS